jgi:hypothetical protein
MNQNECARINIDRCDVRQNGAAALLAFGNLLQPYMYHHSMCTLLDAALRALCSTQLLLRAF